MIKRHSQSPEFSLLMVVHSFRSERIGGVECYSYNLAKEMQAKGVSVTVLYPVTNSGVQNYSFVSSIYNGLRLVKLNVPFGNIVTSVSAPRIDYALECLLQANRFDMVHFHHTYFDLSMVMADVVLKAGIPVAMTLHDFWFICPHIFLYNLKHNEVCSGPENVEKCSACCAGSTDNDEEIQSFIGWRQDTARRLLASIDLLYAPSVFVAEIFRKYSFGAGKIHVSPLGTQKIQANEKKKSEYLRFAYLGTINPLKNINSLIHAFSRTSGQARLEIFGSGEKSYIHSMFEIMMDSRIRYSGKFTPEDLQEIFAGIDLLVLPSWSETYSFILREALSAGIPVIAANRGAIPEIVKDGVNGFLFDPADNEQLTGIMQKIIDDRTILAQLDPGKVEIISIAEDAEHIIADYMRLIDRSRPAVHGDPA